MSVSRQRPHIVIVEDVADQAEVLRIMLDEFEVTTFGSGAEALAAIAAIHPDIFLIDIGLRGMDGLEFFRRVHALPELCKVPAIALSAFAYPLDKERCLNAGFAAHVTKPVLDFDALRNLVRETLNST